MTIIYQGKRLLQAGKKKMVFKRRFLTTGLSLFISMFLCITAGCSTGFLPRKDRETPTAEITQIDKLIFRAYESARRQISKQDNSQVPLRPYMEALIADQRLTVGLGIGTEDLGKIIVPEKEQERICRKEYEIYGKKILVEARLILTRNEFQKALAECEIIFVTSHSRFGAGPVFLKEGKAWPYRMQKTKDYEIIMPQSEVSGYNGTVKRTYPGPLKKKNYVVFAPDSTDLEKALPLHGYQMLVLSTCSSKKHFLDEIAEFRSHYPTTAIFTTRACCMDRSMRVFMRLLYEIFQGKSINGVVKGMNEEYRNISWENVRKRIPPWQVINNLYTVGIHTCSEE